MTWVNYVKKIEIIINKKNLLELISDFSRVAEYKVNIQKPIIFLYTSKKQLKLEIKR